MDLMPVLPADLVVSSSTPTLPVLAGRPLTVTESVV